jgi:hypothetical protein
MKPLITYSNAKPPIIKMEDMEPFSFAIIVDDSVPSYQGKLVWRITENIILDMTTDLFSVEPWFSKSIVKVQPVEVKMTLEVM